VRFQREQEEDPEQASGSTRQLRTRITLHRYTKNPNLNKGEI